MSENPFYPTRYERDHRPLIWVSPLAETLMREQGAFYIAGSRGSGKTSILKSLDAEERLINETLASQVTHEQLEFVGVYFRATDLFTQSTDGFDWAKFAPNSPDAQLLETSYISALIELTTVRILIDDLTLLRRRRRIKYTSVELATVIGKVVGLYPGLFAPFKPSDEDPMARLSKLISDAIQGINAALVRGDRDEFLFCTRLGQQGTFLNAVVPILLTLAGPPQFRRSSPRLKICIDECDYLVPSQQRILNSLVRISRSPIEWVLAYVDTEYDSLSTTFPRQNLTDADRKVVALDDQQSSTEFGLRCQAIASYRLFYALSAERQAQVQRSEPKLHVDELFDLKIRLPNAEINPLIHGTLTPRAPLSNRVRKFIDDVVQFREGALALAREAGREGSAVSRVLGQYAFPYYQKYLFDKFGMRMEDYFGKKKPPNEGWASVLRRKEVAAMLMLLDDLKIKDVPYAGASMILTLSDGCIRDFLEIMSAIYEQWRAHRPEAGPLQFLQPSETLFAELQRKGIEQSSHEKFRGISEARSLRDDLSDPNTAQIFSRVISGLGKLTRALQVSDDRISSLRTAERGIFIVDRGALEKLEGSLGIEPGSCLRTLRRLESENLIVATSERLAATQIQRAFPVYRFRLHKRFSPMFGFSYRGALVDVKLPESVLIELIYSSGKFVEEGWLKQTQDRMASSLNQSDLFGIEQ